MITTLYKIINKTQRAIRAWLIKLLAGNTPVLHGYLVAGPIDMHLEGFVSDADIGVHSPSRGVVRGFRPEEMVERRKKDKEWRKKDKLKSKALRKARREGIDKPCRKSPNGKHDLVAAGAEGNVWTGVLNWKVCKLCGAHGPMDDAA